MARTSERVPRYVRRTVTLLDQPLAELALLLFRCAKTVSEPDLFHPPGFLADRRQIPRIVVNVGNLRKPMEYLEPISLPWAQGSGVQIAPPRPLE